MLDMFFDIFRIKAPNWYPNFLSGKRITGKPFFLIKIFYCNTFDRLNDLFIGHD